MARKKPYDDGCASAHALDLIGERWALLIVRELIPGPKRFSDLKAALPGVSTNILTTRLTELEAGHVLVRAKLPPPAGSKVYQLTPWGAELEPLIKDLGRWAAQSPELAPGKPMSAASVMLSFRTMFNAERAAGLDFEAALVLDGVPHRLRIEADRLEIEIGKARAPAFTLAGDPNLVAGLVYGGMTLDAVRAEGLSVAGDAALIERFAGLFPLPQKAERTAS
jgi:DNA-binding HxlR family transcriptional regulator